MSELEPSEDQENETLPHLQTVEAAVLHLKEGDILICTVSEAVIAESGYAQLAQQVRQLIGNTGRKNVGFVIVPAGDVTFEVLKNDRELGWLQMQVTELKGQIAKLLPPK